MQQQVFYLMQQNSYQNIKSKLNQFQKKYFLNELIKGIIRFVFYAFLFVFLFVLLEYFLWLSPGLRGVLFYSAVVIFIILFGLFIFVPLLNLLGIKKTLSDEKAAVLIGKFFPEIQDKLLNLLQLNTQNNQSELLLASIDQKAVELKPFRFSKAIDFKKNTKYLPLLFIPFLIIFALKLFHFDKPLKQSYGRIISYNKQFTPPIPYKIQVLSKDRVISGQDYKLLVKITGNELPEKVFIDRGEGNRILLQKQNDSIFNFNFTTVKYDFSYELIADNHHFGPYNVKLIHPPLITKNSIHLVYPSYLKLKNKTLQHQGNFTVPSGTKIIWHINTQYADSLYFNINNKRFYPKKTESNFNFSYIAKNSFDYQINVKNKDFQSPSALSFHIDVIPDQYPELKVKMYIDTLNNINKHFITGSDDYGLTSLKIFYKKIGSNEQKSIKIPLNNIDLFQTKFNFPDTIKLEKGKEYSYYFRLYDNDKFNRYKSVKSQVYYYNKLSNNKLKDLLLQQQSKDLHQLSKLNERFDKNNKNLKSFNENLTQQKKLDWKSKKLLEQQINEQEKEEQFFKNSLKKFKNLLNKLPDDKKNLTKEELKKRLEELKKLDKKKKLLDELKKMMDKLKKEDLVKKLKDLQNYSEHQEKSLERILELTKKYYMQQKMAQMADKLNKLAKKQDSLSKQNSDTKKQQDSLNKQLSKMQKTADSLQKANKKLKRPMKMPDAATDMEEIKQDMQKASNQLQQQDANSANKSQKKAANKMKQLSKSMQMMMSGGGGEQQEEDIKTLQALLKSLLNFSFTQEKLLKNYQGLDDKNNLSIHLLQQNRQRKYFKHISDSLYTLALRNPKISQLILDASYNIESELNKTLESLSETHSYFSMQHAQYVLTGANTLADMLSNALDNMKNSMSMQGQGQGKKKGKSFSLPDIIKKQGEALKQMQDAMKKKGDKKGKNKGDKKGDKNKDGKKDGKQGNKESDSEKQYELYKQQQQIKDELNQLSDKFRNPTDKEKISRLIKQMDELERKLLKEGITKSTLNKMLNLQHELLKLKNATFTQHEDEKRRSRTNFNQFNTPDSLFYQKNPKFAPEDELLQRKQIPVNQQVKKKIKEFLSDD